ncbi:CPBP family intramembrane glutamic endopeptidase [Acetohalobium arabaticum]|uniref:Abortive infection protein n=1 Tax=Acetohalobium arabaticum (strain ATCC 49924 / DSM 5501 / Z-7288) TaxID=574087 RepID=D9QRC3_ACEAZ|nr:type II CAAX endopeptidase family protein [Acetohalobium arabaticum]ADL13064.1 Abortive infection protein [Acetohalobium arabaticum DSM 5501]
MFKSRYQNQKVVWTGTDILLIILITISMTLLFNFLVASLLEHLSYIIPGVLSYKQIIVNFLQFATMLIVSMYIIFTKYGLSLKILGFQMIDLKKMVTLGIIGGFGICSMAMLVNLGVQKLIMEWWGIVIPSQPIITELMESQNQLTFILYASLIVIVAPITEEVFFRGLMYQYFKDRFGLFKGGLLAAVIFGALHFSLWSFLATFLGGLGLIILYEVSQSLYTSIIAHATWNFIIVTIIYVLWQVNGVV